VVVPEDHRPAESIEALEDLSRLGAALDSVAEADDVLDPEPLELRDDARERRVVAVDVGDERERHRNYHRARVERPRPHGTEPDGCPPSRGRPHRALQLALRTPSRRRVPRPHREHRYKP